jgi:uncharacterized protein (TIGR04255 family)
VDVDVFTKDGFSTASREAVIAWINDAHTVEKDKFFQLLTDRTMSELKER